MLKATMVIHTLDEQGLPPPDLEGRLARHIHAAPLLQGKILRSLAGHPKRFQELVHDLRVRHDNSLTQALKALRREGLIDQRLDAATKPSSYVYELSGLGVDVLLLVERLQFSLEVKAISEAA